MEPSGLLGEVRNTTLGCCSDTTRLRARGQEASAAVHAVRTRVRRQAVWDGRGHGPTAQRSPSRGLPPATKLPQSEYIPALTGVLPLPEGPRRPFTLQPDTDRLTAAPSTRHAACCSVCEPPSVNPHRFPTLLQPTSVSSTPSPTSSLIDNSLGTVIAVTSLKSRCGNPHSVPPWWFPHRPRPPTYLTASESTRTTSCLGAVMTCTSLTHNLPSPTPTCTRAPT